MNLESKTVEKRTNLFYLTEEDFPGNGLKAEYYTSEEDFFMADAKRRGGKLDAGRTVRSGMAYDFDSTVAVSPVDAARAAKIKAELGDAPVTGIEDRLAYRFAKRTFDCFRQTDCC